MLFYFLDLLSKCVTFAVFYDVWGVDFPKGQEGVYAFGNGMYYFAYAFKTPENKRGGIIKLCKRSDNPEVPFEPILKD